MNPPFFILVCFEMSKKDTLRQKQQHLFFIVLEIEPRPYTCQITSPSTKIQSQPREPVLQELFQGGVAFARWVTQWNAIKLPPCLNFHIRRFFFPASCFTSYQYLNTTLPKINSFTEPRKRCTGAMKIELKILQTSQRDSELSRPGD